MRKNIFAVFCLIIAPCFLNALCINSPILAYTKDGQNIRVFHCGFEGRNYIELRNRIGKYSIFCELNKGQRIYLLANHNKGGGYGYEGDAISDTTNNRFSSPNHTEHHILAQNRRVYISDIEKMLLKNAIGTLLKTNSLNYDLHIDSILFFVPVKI